MVDKEIKQDVESQIRGARSERLFKRNRVLVARYFYWTDIRRRRYDDVIRILEEDEFFVEYQTISRILNAYDAYYNYLKGTLPPKFAIKSLKKEYPSWNWG